MQYKYTLFLIIFFLFYTVFALLAQPLNTYHTFRDTRIVTMHSTEVLAQHKLDVRITQRFSDLAGTEGGWKTFFGLDNTSDAAFGLEYGLLKNLTIGISRSKGTGELKQNINGLVKYRLFKQENQGGSPIDLTLLNVSSLSTMPKDTNVSLQSFLKFAHRFAFTTQVLMSRKFSNRFSMQATGGFTYRNIVPKGDEHGIATLGLGSRILLTKHLVLLADATLPITGQRALTEKSEKYFPMLSAGLEFNTGGHVFQFNFGNAKGIVENDYIPYTQSNWAKGQFRLGFTVSRLFNL